MKKTIQTIIGGLALGILFMFVCGSLASCAIPGQTGSTNSGHEKEISVIDVNEQRAFTQEELDAVLSLKIDGYEKMTVDAFNEHINNELFMSENGEYTFECYNKVSLHLLNAKPEYEFILTTLNLSLTELAASINNETQNYIYYSFKNEVADGTDPYDGDTSYSSYLVVPCDIYYTIDNADTVTVDTRDRAFIEYRDLLQQEIDGIPITDYTSDNLQNQLNDTFEKTTRSINTEYADIKFSFEIIEVLHKP